jgi:tRNA dimethylallyltransferase
MTKPKVIAVAGPTASGKTALAIKLAHERNGEIISADSRLVYKGFDIASAKPTIEEREGIPHHLIDIVEPEVDYSVGDFYKDAKPIIADIISRGKTPIVAGGTGLYFRILLEDFDLPKMDPNPELRAELESMPVEILYQEVLSKDPITAEKVHINNKIRLVRVLEVMRTFNRPFSQVAGKKENEYDVEWISPKVESREVLYERINLRVDKMLELGLIEETKTLLAKHGRIKNFVKTIGYAEILDYLDDKCTLEESLETLKQNTRRYAKRQLTWFRRNPELDMSY